jgi:hypothetical protein
VKRDEDILAQLRSEVVSAAGRHEERRAPRRGPQRPALFWLAAAAVVLAVLGGVVLVQPDQASAGVEIISDESGLTLRLTDLATRPEEVEEAARLAGVDVSVTLVPVGPSLVGRFLGSSGTALPQELAITEGDGSAFTGFRIPNDFDKQIDLRMGRPAEDGEEWGSLSDARAPGEVLECQDLVGISLGDALERIDRLDVGAVQVMLLDEARWLEPGQIDDHRRTTVMRLMSPAPDTVWIDAAEDVERFTPPIPFPKPDC